jgi:hypothetical protein
MSNESAGQARFWLLSDSRYFISLIANLRKMTFPTDSTPEVKGQVLQSYIQFLEIQSIKNLPREYH